MILSISSCSYITNALLHFEFACKTLRTGFVATYIYTGQNTVSPSTRDFHKMKHYTFAGIQSRKYSLKPEVSQSLKTTVMILKKKMNQIVIWFTYIEPVKFQS